MDLQPDVRGRGCGDGGHGYELDGYYRLPPQLAGIYTARNSSGLDLVEFQFLALVVARVAVVESRFLADR